MTSNCNPVWYRRCFPTDGTVSSYMESGAHCRRNKEEYEVTKKKPELFDNKKHVDRFCASETSRRCQNQPGNHTEDINNSCTVTSCTWQPWPTLAPWTTHLHPPHHPHRDQNSASMQRSSKISKGS
ncbi:SS18-like protein 2 isoform X1 [Phyllopteryx taeniolatus]|uniref:SS18-like protein 2 isoform X1 n=1 Tax=Phyllopteryx taeniolatus TaxID=161469 RepID=UPI002AD3509F|nr:SS18-like protein 2 isoform X1 [Phyllopteryx taeniolatus]